MWLTHDDKILSPDNVRRIGCIKVGGRKRFRPGVGSLKPGQRSSGKTRMSGAVVAFASVASAVMRAMLSATTEEGRTAQRPRAICARAGSVCTSSPKSRALSASEIDRYDPSRIRDAFIGTRLEIGKR